MHTLRDFKHASLHNAKITRLGTANIWRCEATTETATFIFSKVWKSTARSLFSSQLNSGLIGYHEPHCSLLLLNKFHGAGINPTSLPHQDFRTATLFFNCVKPFMSSTAGSGELVWKEGERGQLSPRPLLWGSTPRRIWPQAVQMTLTACSYTMGTTPSEDTTRVCLSLPKRENKAGQGILLLLLSTLG